MELSGGKAIVLAVIVVVAIVVVGTLLWMVGTYNDLVEENEAIDGQWAQAQNEYQRKFDLIPELVNLTDSYLNWEASTLTNITSLRSQWAEARDSGDAEGVINASNALDAQAAQIILTVENYPGLDGIVVVDNLMYEITGTENRITVARMRYNEDVQAFNTHIKKFPASYVAGWGDFEEREYYEGGPNTPSSP